MIRPETVLEVAVRAELLILAPVALGVVALVGLQIFCWGRDWREERSPKNHRKGHKL